MIWEAPVIEDIACGMEVTAYVSAEEADEFHDAPAVAIMENGDD